MDEATEVSLVEAGGEVSIRGPTSYAAPMLADQLARKLLEKPRNARASFELVRFRFFLPHLLTFSFDLSPDAFGGLCAIAPRFVFELTDCGDQRAPRPFERQPDSECTTSLSVVGETLDPTEATRLLGVEPSRAHRMGDIIAPRAKRRAEKGYWGLDTKGKGEEADVNALIARLLAKLSPDPSSWATLRDRHQVRMVISASTSPMSGGFELEPVTTRALGALGVTVGVWLGNMDA